VRVPTLRLSEIARAIDGTLEGDRDPVITGVSGIREAEAGQVSFLAHPRYAPYVSLTKATALIVGPEGLPGEAESAGAPLLVRVENPYHGFLKALTLFGGDRRAVEPGIHPSAVVAEGVLLGSDVSIGAHVVLERGVVLGDRVALLPGVFVGEDAVLGNDCFLWPNVVVRERCRLGRRVVVHAGSVIGSDGFGYVRDGERQLKVPQVGIVDVGDDVEIGAGVTIDRATTGATTIGEGVKIDNLVQVAHNVTIGPHSVVCAQVGISGSARIGEAVTIGGQAGIIGHIYVGDRVVVAGKSGVTKSVPPDTRVSGYPAEAHEQALRAQAHARRLPDLVREVRDLKSRLEALERELEKERERAL
jgi:UDP-3-O-[3-hydroxymyristoyl] glucosamine N-acyltransferase